jgi:hypothetical protein
MFLDSTSGILFGVMASNFPKCPELPSRPLLHRSHPLRTVSGSITALKNKPAPLWRSTVMAVSALSVQP